MKLLLVLISSLLLQRPVYSQPGKPPLAILAYYSGNGTDLGSYPIEKITHLIYCFAHLKNNELHISPAAGAILQKLQLLKKRNAALKILLAFGGWGGCKTCSAIFAVPANRQAFAASTQALLQKYQLDGIDMDWEFPALESLPGHSYATSDKQHFTELIKTLRTTLGNTYEISFAAGIFPEYLYQSVEWLQVMPLVNRVHLMTYDMVNRKSVVTGHHSSLYSTPQQPRSIDQAIRFFDSLQIARNKLVIGAAFYARVYEQVDSINQGLYRPGLFSRFAVYKYYNQTFSQKNGFKHYWDETACAPYCYNAGKKLFGTYDNVRSVQLKTTYAATNKLFGLLFWELRQDSESHQLLNAIYAASLGNSK